MTSPSIHHSVVIVEDLDASVRFYRDGLGLAVLVDRTVDGDWPKLFGAPTTTLRVVFTPILRLRCPPVLVAELRVP